MSGQTKRSVTTKASVPRKPASSDQASLIDQTSKLDHSSKLEPSSKRDPNAKLEKVSVDKVSKGRVVASASVKADAVQAKPKSTASGKKVETAAETSQAVTAQAIRMQSLKAQAFKAHVDKANADKARAAATAVKAGATKAAAKATAPAAVKVSRSAEGGGPSRSAGIKTDPAGTPAGKAPSGAGDIVSPSATIDVSSPVLSHGESASRAPAVPRAKVPETKMPEAKVSDSKTIDARTSGAAKPLVAKPEDKSAKIAKVVGNRQGFKTLEYIVYPAHGVGQITAIEEQEVAGYKLELFVISFVKDKMILKVPTPKVASVGMRKLAEAPVVKRALDTLMGRARVKRTMWSRRAQEYEAKINSGDLVSIAEVVRDLYRSDAQPEQSYSERQLYEAALDRMAREIAAVQKLTDQEALKVIDEQLQKGPRRVKAEESDGADADDADEGEPGGIVEAA